MNGYQFNVTREELIRALAEEIYIEQEVQQYLVDIEALADAILLSIVEEDETDGTVY